MEKTWKPMVAGILDIVSGVCGLITFIALIIGAVVTSNPAVFHGDVPPVNVPAICVSIAIPYLIIGIVALLGGIYALQRKKWVLALTGSVVAIFSTFILGILATVFIGISNNEFE